MRTWTRLAASIVGVAALLVASPSFPSEAQDGPVPTSHVGFNAVYVVNGGDGESGSITVINADSNVVAATIPLPGAM